MFIFVRDDWVSGMTDLLSLLLVLIGLPSGRAPLWDSLVT